MHDTLCLLTIVKRGHKLELRVLRYFLAVCQEKNISHAANALHISQPSLSRQLKNLEKELGVSLFNRGHQEITLTQEGYYLRDHAQEIINMVNKTKSNLEKTQVVSGELYIGAGESIALKRVMKVTDSILKEYPDVKFNFYSGTAPDVEAKIDEGSLDFGITMGQSNLSNYDSLTLPEKNEYGIVINKNHPLANKDSVTMEDIEKYPIVISARTQTSNSFRDFVGDDSKLNIVATINLGYNINYLLKEGNYCFFSYINFGREVIDSDLVYKRFSSPYMENNRLIWRKNVELSNVGQLFLDRLKNSIEEEKDPLL